MSVVDGLLSSLNVDLRWWSDRLRYPLASSSQRRSVGDVTARFAVETFREFRRVQDFTDEGPVIADLLSYVTDEDTFYDIGANVGTHSCFVGQSAKHVYAFEPHPETAERLRENLRSNDVPATVYQLALGDHEGTAELFRPADTAQQLGTGEFSLLESSESAASWSVDVIPGDVLVSRDQLPTPDVVKIDVEGAELQVIDGLADSLSETRVVYCEVHPEHVAVAAVHDQFDSLGFATELVGKRDGGHSFVRAVREQ
jgi:FkbM family methyltransferase